VRGILSHALALGLAVFASASELSHRHSPRCRCAGQRENAACNLPRLRPRILVRLVADAHWQGARRGCLRRLPRSRPRGL